MALSHRCLWLSLTGDLDSITELHGGRVFNLRAIPLTAYQLGPLLAHSGHANRLGECLLSEAKRTYLIRSLSVR